MTKRNQNEVRPEDSLTFAGLETCDEDRAKAAALSMREEMETRLRSTRGDISAKAGRMERESPLFFGTGDNPGLFQ
jgi:hypothetical protein